jgi:hypothetical protein
MSPGKVEFAWKTAVGPAMQRMTAVRLEGRVLLVEARSIAWQREVLRSSATVLARLKALLGDQVIAEIRLRS